MPTLHMVTETVDENSRFLIRQSTDMLNILGSMRSSLGGVDYAWQGQASYDFIYDLERILNQIEKQIYDLDDLSKRMNREVNQWLETDSAKFRFSDYYQLGYDLRDLPDDVKKVSGALFIINAFHKISPLRPNSVSIHGTIAKLKSVGFGPSQRIMKPETILKQLKGTISPVKGGVIAGLTDGLLTGIDSYFTGEYAGTSRALPAAITDGVVKGVVTGLVTALIIGAAGLFTAGIAAPIVAATAVIGITVIGGLVIDKFILDPMFRAWQKSDSHAQAVEGATRIGNNINNYLDYRVHKDINQVRSAFDNVFRSLNNAMVPS